MHRKKCLLHDMKCIETLARVDVLCVDKTGTITENTMKVQKLIKTDEYDEKEKGGYMLLLSRRFCGSYEQMIILRWLP